MKIIAKPKKEKEILENVKKNADAAKIRKSIIAKADYCVNHLCGCK